MQWISKDIPHRVGGTSVATVSFVISKHWVEAEPKEKDLTCESDFFFKSEIKLNLVLSCVGTL